MFKEKINSWNNSKRDKACKMKYLHELNDSMMQISELKQLIGGNSTISSITVDARGIYETLDESRGNMKMYFEENDCEAAPVEVMCSLDYEKTETEMFLNITSEIMHSGFTMLDIGANVGWYTLLASNVYRKEGVNIYSFEPSPITCKRLKKNIELNELPQTRAFNIGLYNEKTSLEFYYDIEGSGGSSFVNLREREKVKKIVVDVEKLDDFVEKNGIQSIDFIKCDVEGSELFVFEGGRKVLERDQPVIFSEMLRKWSAKFNYTPNDIIQLMKGIGYECYAIEAENRLRYCPIVTEETVETNYYFLNLEKHRGIIQKYGGQHEVR